MIKFFRFSLLLFLLSVLFILSSDQLKAKDTKSETKTPTAVAFESLGKLVPPDIESIQKEGVLRVGILSQDVSPFFFIDRNGELDGIDVNFAKKIASELGVRIEFVKSDTFDGVIDSVAQKKVHMAISKLSVTMKRSQKVRFVGEYVKMSKALLLNRVEFKKIREKGINTLDEAFQQPEAIIGVVEKSAYETFARQLFPKATIKQYKKWDDLVTAAFKGEVTAALRDEWEVRKTLDKRPDMPLYAEAVFLKNQNDPIKIAVAWDSFQLAEFINSFVLLNDQYRYNLDRVFKLYKKYSQDNKSKKDNK